MPVGRAAPRPNGVVRVAVQGDRGEDRGAGIIVAASPLTVLVPTHVIDLLETDQDVRVVIDDGVYDQVKILPTPALSQDHLSVIRASRRGVRTSRRCLFPKRHRPIQQGLRVALRRPGNAPPLDGAVTGIWGHADGGTLVTDIPIECGESGSPLMVDGRVIAVCQGRIRTGDRVVAVAMPLSQGGLDELRRLAAPRWRAVGVIAVLFGLLGVAMGGFVAHSNWAFTIGEIHISDDGELLEVRNTNAWTVHPQWKHDFSCGIKHVLAFASGHGDRKDRLAVGTICPTGVNGTFYLFDARGRVLWTHAVPPGDCIYTYSEAVYDQFMVDGIHVADVDGDGLPEILVIFNHSTFYPGKLVVLNLAGDVLAEYWHPGWIRTLQVGRVGPDQEIMVVVTGSNNAIRPPNTWWNPQVLFAFRGLDIYGHAPPYDFRGAALHPDYPRESELWYKVILPVELDRIDEHRQRGNVYSIGIADYMYADGMHDIQVSAQEGRIYYLNEQGETLLTRIGNAYMERFPGVPVPPLMDIWEFVDTYVRVPPAPSP